MMLDIVSIVGIWLTSMVSGLVSIRQSKGVDWYTPITSRHNMMMTLINASGLAIIIIMFFKFIFLDTNQFWFVIIVVIIVTLIVIGINLLKKFKGPQKTPGTDEDKGTLIDLFRCFITVFNSVYFVLSIVYLCYICNRYAIINDNLENTMIVLEKIFSNDNFVTEMFIFLFYSLVIGVIVTSTGWVYEDKIDRNKNVKNKDANFAVKRVKSRGRR